MILSFSCRKNTIEVVKDQSLKYFPLEIGHTWVYQMDSLHYEGGGIEVDTFSFQTRHEVVAQFEDNEGNKAYRVEIQYRLDSADNWKFGRNYQLTYEENSIIRTDFDQDEILAMLPVSNEKYWNGNEYNSKLPSDYYYLDVHQPGMFGVMNFDSTISIHQEEKLNLIENFSGLEVYAAHMGLVYREKFALKDIHDPENTSGYSYKFRLGKL